MNRRARSSGRLRATALYSAFAGALIVGTFAADTAVAQSSSDLRYLTEQVRALQQQVKELQAQLYGGGVSSGGPAVATHEVRLQQIEAQLRELTGRIEEARYQGEQLGKRLDRMNADIEFRLQALEQGAAAPAVAGATPPAPSETAPQPAAAATATAPAPDPSLTAPSASGGVLGTLPADPQTGDLLPAVTSGTADTPEAQYQAAFALLRQAKYPEAESAFKDFLARFPDGPLAGNAQYWLGETYYVRSDFQNAAVAFAQGYQRYPDSSKAPDNLLKLSMSLSELGRTADACAALNQLQAKFPTLPEKIADRAQQQRQRNKCG